MQNEEWRPTHHPDYDVSNLGRVRSRARGTLNLLKPGIASHGYPTVCFGRGNTLSVHVLVAAAFIGPCPDGQECRHKDDDRTNARADNLEYGTRKDNVRDMYERGRQNNPGFLVSRQVRNIRRILDCSRRGPSMRARRGLLPEIANAYGVSVGTIKAISAERRWKNV